MVNGIFTTSSSKYSETFDDDAVKKLFEEMKNLPEPEGLVLLPNGSEFDMYKFPANVIKGALLLILNKEQVQPPTTAVNQ